MQPRLNQAHSSALLDLQGKIGPSKVLIDKIGPIAPYKAYRDYIQAI